MTGVKDPLERIFGKLTLDGAQVEQIGRKCVGQLDRLVNLVQDNQNRIKALEREQMLKRTLETQVADCLGLLANLEGRIDALLATGRPAYGAQIAGCLGQLADLQGRIVALEKKHSAPAPEEESA